MAERDQQRHDDQSRVTGSTAQRLPQDALNDRGDFADPAVADERHDPEELSPVTGIEPSGRQERPFYEPPGPPTAFGATTVGGAVAAAALAGPRRPIGPEPRDDDTVADGDGPVGDHVPAIDRHAVAEPPRAKPGEEPPGER